MGLENKWKIVPNDHWRSLQMVCSGRRSASRWKWGCSPWQPIYAIVVCTEDSLARGQGMMGIWGPMGQAPHRPYRRKFQQGPMFPEN